MINKKRILFCFLLSSFLSVTIHPQSFRLKRPVSDSIQSQGNYLYGEPWFWGSEGAHRGLDMWIVYDTVYSATDGYVEFAAYTPGEDGYEPNGFGNYLRTRSEWDGKTIYIYYAHLSELLVNSGESIRTGEPIAISGSTGNSTGPHLHFEIREGDSYYLAERTRRNPELWFAIEGMGAIYGRVPNAEDNTRVDISPDPKPRPPYTTFGYGLTYGFYDKTIGSDDLYSENYAFGDVKPGTYTITALDGAYTRSVTVKAGEIINADKTVGVKEDNGIATEFYLSQNYPNPFNPSTTIKYSIPIMDSYYGFTTNVVLKVYDMLGHEVVTLVNKEQLPGNYKIIFNGEKLSSGVYYYSLLITTKTKRFSETKKMLILK